MNNEIICGINEENLQYLHTGILSPYVFSIEYRKAHEKKVPHIIVRVFAKSLDGLFLVQKRSQFKTHHKMRWTDSASGHVRYASNFKYEDIEQNAFREFKEEMGGKLLSIRFIGFSSQPYINQNSNNYKIDYEISYNFIGICDKNISLNLKEVSPESKFFTKEELENLLKVPRTENFKPWVEESRIIWNEIISGKYDYLFEDMIKEIKIMKKKKKVNYSKYKIGLVIGRFQPFHNGHLLLIKKCLEIVDILKIGIGSSQTFNEINNPFSSDERKAFIIESLKEEKIAENRCLIYNIPDKFNFQEWISSIFEIIGDFDVIFTNNLWIGRIFQLRGKKFINNFKFNFKKYNGTYIRKLLYNQNRKWQKLVPMPVRNYLLRKEILNRIYLIYIRNQKE